MTISYTTPQVDGQRMNDTLQFSCQWGATPDGGMNRLSLNDDDATVRRWFIAEVKKLGCEVKVDSMGNIFAIMKGKREDLAPLGMGSHLDTQPTGGRYDGILGVTTALEVLKAVKDSGYVTNAPLAAICWTNEEGARFTPAMVSSGVWGGVFTEAYGHSRADENGITMKDELMRHGFLGDVPCSFEANPLSAHFEVHIEQGPILDVAGDPVAVVKGGQGLKWFNLEVTGRGQHAGTTPMSMRADPLCAVARMILAAERMAPLYGGNATVGRIGSPSVQSTNCILPNVTFSMDLRNKDDDKMEEMDKAIRAEFNKISKEAGVEITKFEIDVECPAPSFAPAAEDSIRQACVRSGHKLHEIASGAGHDSYYTARKVPTAMLFIRCKDGISHNPAEYSSPEDITTGAQVFLDAVLSYDHNVNGA